MSVTDIAVFLFPFTSFFSPSSIHPFFPPSLLHLLHPLFHQTIHHYSSSCSLFLSSLHTSFPYLTSFPNLFILSFLPLPHSIFFTDVFLSVLRLFPSLDNDFLLGMLHLYPGQAVGPTPDLDYWCQVCFPAS